jgi:broad specificity phosphatase PhoE
MGTLYLVRHGQASFGAADYDQLSDLGARQCERLGAWFRGHGIAFEAILTGTLRRHAQSLAAIEAGLGASGSAMTWPGLNEYDPQAIMRAAHPQPVEEADPRERARQHFRLLRQGLATWMSAATPPEGLPPHAEFVQGVVGALDHVRAHHADGCVLVVSSGGPIAHAVGHVLGLGHAAVIDLNLHLRNSAVCELRVTPRRHTLLTFNALPHLEAPEHTGWITYA